MKASFRIALVLVLTLCEVRKSVSLPSFNESSVEESSDAESSAVETENLNDEVDFLLESVAESLPSEMKLDDFGDYTDKDCTLQGLWNGVKRQGDAVVKKVSEDEVIVTFGTHTNAVEVRCVPRKEDEESPAPALQRPSWLTKTWKKVIKIIRQPPCCKTYSPMLPPHCRQCRPWPIPRL